MISNPSELALMAANPLFKGFSSQEISRVLYCLRSSRRKFPKGSFLFEEGDKADYACLLLSGSVDLVRYGEDGTSSIFESFRPGDSFGEAYALKDEAYFGLSAYAREDIEAVFIYLKPLLGEMSCLYGQRLMKNLVLVLAEKDLLMKNKLNVLSQKGLKGKVLEFLSSFAQGKKKVFFILPYSRQEMAEYLGCDRSALSRLLSEMKEEKAIDFKGDSFLIY